MAIAVLHANDRFVAGCHAGKVPLQRCLGTLPIVRIAKPRPGVNGCGLQFIQRIAQHFGPDGVEHRLTRLHVPLPGGGTRAINGALQLVPPTLQLQFAQLAVVHILEGAVHPDATPVHHFGRANAAHPHRVPDMVEQLLLLIPTDTGFNGLAHGATSLLPDRTIREEVQCRFARDLKICGHLEQAAGDAGPSHDVALDIQVPSTDARGLVGHFQVPLGLLQRLLCCFARRDVSADGHKSIDGTVVVTERRNQGVHPVQLATLGAVAHLAVPRLARADGGPKQLPELVRMVARIHNIVRTANQLCSCVATDFGKRIIDLRDDPLRIGLRDNGMLVDGAHQRGGFSQRSLHALLRQFALRDILLDSHEALQRAVVCAHWLNSKAHPVTCTVFGLVEDFGFNRLAGSDGPRQQSNGGRIGFGALQHCARFTP